MKKSANILSSPTFVVPGIKKIFSKKFKVFLLYVWFKIYVKEEHFIDGVDWIKVFILHFAPRGRGAEITI